MIGSGCFFKLWVRNWIHELVQPPAIASVFSAQASVAQAAVAADAAHGILHELLRGLLQRPHIVVGLLRVVVVQVELEGKFGNQDISFYSRGSIYTSRISSRCGSTD
jgi:hypothetical protein